MHHGECSCYQGLQNIELKTVVWKEPDCVMIWMNWFDAEKNLQHQIPTRSGRSVLITCCGLFYLTEGLGPAAERERREMCVCRIVGECVCCYPSYIVPLFIVVKGEKIFLLLQVIQVVIGKDN